MNAWQRFARQRLARSRWNSDPTALEPADTQAFEQAWQRQCHMEQAIVARVPESDIPAALLENIAASLAVWLDEGEFTPPERAAIVLHHARLEVGFTDIARQAPQPDPPPAADGRWRPRSRTPADPRPVSANQRLPGRVCSAGSPPFPLPKRPGRGPSGLD